MTNSATIRVAIAGHGNLGRGVELALMKNDDMVLQGIYSRRPVADVRPLTPGASVFPMAALDGAGEEIDVLILCGGSKEDLPQQGPAFAGRFHTVDSFDTHARIPEYFAAVDAPARAGRKTSLISVGWDPGMFSLNRVIGEALVPDGDTYTFWGDGLSQGHSDAIRRVAGVAAGVQYTRPSKEAIEKVRSGARPTLSTRDKHWRECFVVLADGADADRVRDEIVHMPNYFADYETVVHFIDRETFDRDHQGMAHGGFVIRSGNTSADHAQVIEYSLRLESNPQFTASVLVAYARAAWRLGCAGEYGAKTVFDVPPALLSRRSPEELRREFL